MSRTAKSTAVSLSAKCDPSGQRRNEIQPHGGAKLESGIVVATYGQHVLVRSHSNDGNEWLCTQKGKKNQVVTGDNVDINPQGELGQIIGVRPRRNLFFRSDAYKQKSFAANIDRIVYVVACEPPFDPGLLGRAAIAASREQIHFTILLNKIDLQDRVAQTLEQLQDYAPWYDVILVSAFNEEALHKQLAPLFHQQTTLLLGQSGMGKSTLLNVLVPHAKRETQQISTRLATGRHTSTNTQAFQYKHDQHQGVLIDSPGFQVFGLAHLSLSEIVAGMPDISEHLAKAPCRFHNCTHVHEPGCVITPAVGSIIPTQRYALYCQLLQEHLQQRTY